MNLRLTRNTGARHPSPMLRTRPWPYLWHGGKSIPAGASIDVDARTAADLLDSNRVQLAEPCRHGAATLKRGRNRSTSCPRGALDQFVKSLAQRIAEFPAAGQVVVKEPDERHAGACFRVRARLIQFGSNIIRIVGYIYSIRPLWLCGYRLAIESERVSETGANHASCSAAVVVY